MNGANKFQQNESVKIVTYKDDYKEDFTNLNLEWIEEYFTVEEMDRKHLSNPLKTIIDKGGDFFL